MTTEMTPGEVAALHDLTGHAGRAWAWYLTGGILSVGFGVAVLSFEALTILTVAILIGLFLCGWGFMQGIGAVLDRVSTHRWLYVVAALAAIGAGVVALIWPGDSLFALVILLGWAFVVWGLFDIVGAFEAIHIVRYWWLYILRGVVSVIGGALILAWPDIALTVLVTAFGLMLVFWGAVEVIAALHMRNSGRRGAAVRRSAVPPLEEAGAGAAG